MPRHPPPGELSAARPRRSPARLSLLRKFVFTLVVTVGFFVAVEGILGLAGVRPTLEEDDPYVGFASNVPLFVERQREDGRLYHVTAQNKSEWFNLQYFPVEKPAGTFRVFCLGGSTTYGRPYDDKTSFCGWLRELLPIAAPSRDWEVINAGGISYASYRVARLMEELVRYEPDLFVIYTGHNEFLERRTYASVIETPESVRWLESTLGKTRTYTVIRKLLRTDDTVRPQEGKDGRFELPSEVETLLDGAFGPEEYTRDDALTEQATRHLRYNLGRMARLGRRAGAEVIFVTPASNLGSCAPFKSEHRSDLTAEGKSTWASLVEEAERLLKDGAAEEALRRLSRAASIDERYAELHYLRGRCLVTLERFTEAKQAFERARDEDICPLRALGRLRNAVATAATEHSVPLVDFAKLTEESAAHGIPGEDLFYDHVHPKIAAHRLLAVSLIEAMARSGLLELAATWGDTAIEAVRVRVEASLDDAAQGRALRNLAKVLGWAGKFEEADRLAIEAAPLLPNDANAQYVAGAAHERSGNHEAAKHHYEAALGLQPEHAGAHNSLGVLLERSGDRQAAAGHYERALQLQTDFAEAHSNLGSLLARQGDPVRARRHLEEALRIRPDLAKANNDLGIMLAREGRFDAAGPHFEKAIASDPLFAEAHHNLGLVLAQRGALQEAIKRFEEALRLNPNYFQAREMLHEVRAMLGNRLRPR